MFCTNCGKAANGNFCAHCGTKIVAAIEEALPVDWSNEHRYDVLLRYPEVRETIERAAAQTNAWKTGEQYLKIAEKAFEPMMGVSLGTVQAITQPISLKLGLKTGKSRVELIAAPLGKTIVAALCSLARHGRKLSKVQQAEDGCVLEAALPPDLRALAGEILVTIRRAGSNTQVEATTKITGQMFDWGKSKECLNQLFAELQTSASCKRSAAA